MTSPGQLIRRHRRRAGLSQVDLADRAHISERTLRSVERDAEVGHYFSTLWALVDALALSDSEAQALIRGAEESPGVPLDDRSVWELDEGTAPASLETFVGALETHGRDHWRELMTTDLVRVDAAGQIATLRNTRILEPLRLDASSALIVVNGDDSTPVRLCDVAWTRGCKLVDRLDSNSSNLSAFAFSLPPADDPWLPRSITFELSYGARVSEGEQVAYAERPLSDGLTRSSASLGATISIDVQFERPPARVWMLYAARGATGYQRGATLEPDSDGVVQVVRADTTGETLGIGWRWADDEGPRSDEY